MPERPPAIVVDGLHKSFRLPHERVSTLKERMLHPFRRTSLERFEALKPLSFAVPEGEFFGVVGRNGSGKSTLLKCLAGIYRADGGRAWIQGRLSAFIELGVGFNDDLAARDNILINGVMLGLSPREARRRADEIIEFAGLEQFVDLKVKNYSSGMLVRLGFAVLVHVDADVLLIDEVLAVGDAEFQQKCHDQFERIRREGKTVVLVTHDMAAVERYCHRAMLLERGDLTLMGDPHEVGMRYLKVNFDQAARGEGGTAEEDEEGRYGDRRAEILDAWFEDEHGARQAALAHGTPCAFAARVRFAQEVTDPVFGVNLVTEREVPVLSASSVHGLEHSGRFAAGEELTFRVRFDNVFGPGRLHATPAVAHLGQGLQWIDRRERLTSVVVTATRATDAVVDLPYAVELDRSAADAGVTA